MTEDTHLTRAHLVKRHKRKRLRQHRPSQIPLRQYYRDQYGAESELRNKSQRLEVPLASFRGEGGGKMQECVVGGEIVAMVDAGEVVEVRVGEEWGGVDGVH